MYRAHNHREPEKEKSVPQSSFRRNTPNPKITVPPESRQCEDKECTVVPKEPFSSESHSQGPLSFIFDGHRIPYPDPRRTQRRRGKTMSFLRVSNGSSPSPLVSGVKAYPPYSLLLNSIKQCALGYGMYRHFYRHGPDSVVYRIQSLTLFIVVFGLKVPL